MIERRDLERVRDWAHQQLAAGQEPPWAWYQHMKLRETLDAILSSMDRAIQLETAAAEAEDRPEAGIRLVVDNAQQARPRPSRPVPLPN